MHYLVILLALTGDCKDGKCSLPVVSKPQTAVKKPEPAKPEKVGLVRKVGRAVFGKRCK